MTLFFHPHRLILAHLWVPPAPFFFVPVPIISPPLLQPQARYRTTNPLQHSRCCCLPVSTATGSEVSARARHASIIYDPFFVLVNGGVACSWWLVESRRRGAFRSVDPPRVAVAIRRTVRVGSPDVRSSSSNGSSSTNGKLLFHAGRRSPPAMKLPYEYVPGSFYRKAQLIN